MTGIFSREQEFLKINEHLNNMTKYAIEKPQPTKIDSKFTTYTKRGPITVLRQPNSKQDVSVGGLKEKSPVLLAKEHQVMNGARRKVVQKDRPSSAAGERPSVSSPRHFGKNIPGARNSVSKNPSNIVLRYKNSSFIQSPSLEVLVKEENESIRSQTTTSHSSEVSSGRTTARPNSNSNSSDGLVKYLKSRIAILQEEHETLTREMSNQKELVEKSLERQKKIESQRDIAYTKNNTLTEQMTKLEGQLEDALRQLKTTETEHTETRKQLDSAKRELKLLTQTNTNLEKRLYRINEELENSKNTMCQMRNAEKEIKESVRSESDARDKQIKALKKQRADLLNAYKKQLYLIDNLKRQNVCMEQSRMIEFGEKEFTKILDFHSKN